MTKVIWAVDGVGSSKKSLAVAMKGIRSFFSRKEAEIIPVYVLSSNPLALGVLDDQLKTSLESYRVAAEKALSKTMKPFQAQVGQSRVVIEDGSFSRHSVDRLVATAQAEGASMILMSTHAAEGLERLFLGSFAETALLRSKIPLFFVNPKNLPAQKVKTILFPSNLSSSNEKHFKRVLGEARRLKAKVVLYQKLVLPVQPLLSAGSLLLGGVPVVMPLFAEEQATKADRRATAWVELGKADGVKVEWLLDRKPGTIKEGVLRAARAKKAQLIAMCSSSGVIEATLVGSVARQVVREARCPVWVVHA